MILSAGTAEQLVSEALGLKDQVERLRALLVRVLDEDDKGDPDGLSVDLHTDIARAVTP